MIEVAREKKILAATLFVCATAPSADAHNDDAH